MLAVNALVFTLVEHLDSAQHTGGERVAPARAPALLSIADPLIEKLLSQAPDRGAIAGGTDSESPAGTSDGGTRVTVAVRPGESFVRISADVERQYLRALFDASNGDLAAMARKLLGPGGSARRVHLRLNQLGLRLRELRGGRR
jgi:hypothetical protein